ncbi:Z1 domain-containing protein [Streptomyces sp. CA-278952]|uniref:Z1 domain-containing protein n=1 Tax=unclassified Streptomyces TaxID=2593676 RepID=UPI002367B241|nr:Z1 domain-containing protein [Streptomyces sp. CA-278952]WDG32714.1 Z1 domain-containing protein [Streptomyces sp. CA-278952]
MPPKFATGGLDRVVTALGTAAPELDATALVEALWLASRMAASDPPGSGSAVVEPAAEEPPPAALDVPAPRGEVAEPRTRPTEPDDDQSARPLHERLPESSGRVAGHAVAVPGATALPFALELTRALRPWKRSWRAGRRHVLDLDATVDGYARSGELIPAFAPAPERWFDLVLVVDRSASMQVWRETADALADLLDRLGAFRTLQVRDLALHPDSGIELTDRRGQPTSAGQLRSPDGRRLVIVISDCTDPAWRRPEIWQQLRAWAQHEPVALLNPLPPKLWRRTGLDLPTVRASLDVPGASNTGFAFRVPPLLARSAEVTDRDSWFALPVLSLSPYSLGRWARAVMLAAPDGCSAALISPGDRLNPLGPFRPPTPRTPEERTEGFLRTAAPAAARLAVLSCSFGGLSLHLLHVLRRELVPEATTEDLAELLGSGLYELTTGPTGRVVMQPAPRVRERLEQELTEHEVLLLSQVLGRHIASGRNSGERLSAVAGGADGTEELAAEAASAGTALARTLELLGVPTPPRSPGRREITDSAAPLGAEHALRLALALLPQGRSVVHEEVVRAADMVLGMLAKQGMVGDRSALLRQLEAAVAQFAPAVTWEDPQGHEPWYRHGEFARERHFWERYRAFLDRGRFFPANVVHRLDMVTDALLSRLEDPLRPGHWRRSGLAIDHLGSGTVTTVIGLAAKAVDAGYLKIVIIAGPSNAERAQLQRQVDEGLLGFDSAFTASADGHAAIGAGAPSNSRRLPVLSMTDSTEHGDFSLARALRWITPPDPFPRVFVIKRNQRVVDGLYRWLEYGASSPDAPLLVIDTTSGGTGARKPPSALDARVDRLLSGASRSAYVGFTIAPIRALSHLVPDFIYSIPLPPDHAGAEERLPLVRLVTDEEAWLPAGHRSGHVPSPALPDSLYSAIDAFVLACAVRRARGQTRAHNSMLVSVSRFVAVQAQVRDQVAERVRRIADGLREPGSPHASRLMSGFESLWRTDFVPTSAASSDTDTDASQISWDEVAGHLVAAVRKITVMSVNGSSLTLPRWREYDHNGLSVVAVGGTKLGLGTVLEGLTISYCLRSSSTYDTLSQFTLSLARRTAYADLCRLYAGREVLDAQERLTAMLDDQRQEIGGMAELGISPREVALRLHPARVSRSVSADHDLPPVGTEPQNLSGMSCETLRFTLAPEALDENLRELERFVQHLGGRGVAQKAHADGNLVWSGVRPETVLERFFDVYRPASPRLTGRMDRLRAYIRRCVAQGELRQWTVQLVSPSRAASTTEVAGHRIGLVVRRRVAPFTGETFAVRRLSNPRNELVDLDEDQYAAALDATRAAVIGEEPGAGAARVPMLPSRPAVNAVRRPDQALLSIYLVRHPFQDHAKEAGSPLVGIAVAFPVSPTSPEPGAGVRPEKPGGS